MNLKELDNIPFSVLDLATVIKGQTPADSFHNSLALAKRAEKLGFTRYWFAEHHNMINVASSATPILVGYIAGNTSTIRVGSGGIMLPNHAPLIVAEQFGTLASLYPDRIDLGLGRAPGSDQATSRAIRGQNMNAPNFFGNDVQQLQRFLSSENSLSNVRAIPGEGLDIPIWILGSSTDSAYLAAELGLPYAFASHFAPDQFMAAIKLYRQNFKPSQYLETPYAMACVNVVAADTDDEAAYLVTSLQQFFMGIITGNRKLLQPPIENMDEYWGPQEKHMVEQMLSYAFIGGPEKIKTELQSFVNNTEIDEIMVTSHIFDQKARIHSYELFVEAIKLVKKKKNQFKLVA